jgi:hypothetical protein
MLSPRYVLPVLVVLPPALALAITALVPRLQSAPPIEEG